LEVTDWYFQPQEAKQRRWLEKIADLSSESLDQAVSSYSIRINPGRFAAEFSWLRLAFLRKPSTATEANENFGKLGRSLSLPFSEPYV
jgi:hypothetical protein